MTKLVKIFSLLLFAAALTFPMWMSRVANVSAQHANMAMATPGQQPTTRRGHMHMKNWALEPTGIPGVSPLDPTTIPRFVNQLTKPPVHVAVGTRREPSTGNNLPYMRSRKRQFKRSSCRRVCQRRRSMLTAAW